MPFLKEPTGRSVRWTPALAIGAALAVNVVAVFGLRFSQVRIDQDTAPLGVMLETPAHSAVDEPGFNRAEPEILQFTIENKIPSNLLDHVQPDEKMLNGFLDIDDGGTQLRPEGKRPGGGGGAGLNVVELGHVSTDEHVWQHLKWKPDPNASIDVAGSENGSGTSVPGTVKNGGAGDGLGNGIGSGAAGSQGSGTGSGAGVNGSNIGSGMGKAPPLPVTEKPRLLTRSEPAYPNSAREARHSGTVMVSLEVLPTGSVGQVEVKSSSGFSELDDAALSAARGYRFTGATRDGKPVSFWYVVPFRFALTEY